LNGCVIEPLLKSLGTVSGIADFDDSLAGFTLRVGTSSFNPSHCERVKMLPSQSTVERASFAWLFDNAEKSPACLESDGTTVHPRLVLRMECPVSTSLEKRPIDRELGRNGSRRVRFHDLTLHLQ